MRVLNRSPGRDRYCVPFTCDGSSARVSLVLQMFVKGSIGYSRKASESRPVQKRSEYEENYFVLLFMSHGTLSLRLTMIESGDLLILKQNELLQIIRDPKKNGIPKYGLVLDPYKQC